MKIRYIIIILIIAIATVCTVHYLIVDYFKINGSFLTEIKELLNAIHFYTAPALALIAMCLTFLAFYVQYSHNYTHTKDLKQERFENKLFKLIDIHRINTQEINISDCPFRGRKSFTALLHEYRLIYNIVKLIAKSENSQISEEEIFTLSYVHFICGYGTMANKISYKLLDPKYKNIIEKIYSVARFIQSNYGKYSGEIKQKEYHIVKAEEEYGYLTLEKRKESHNAIYKYPCDLILIIKDGNMENYIRYYAQVPFEGHMSDLSIYYNNLYQILEYIDNNKDILDKNKSDEIFDMVLSQMSEHEQAMLKFRILSKFDSIKNKIPETKFDSLLENPKLNNNVFGNILNENQNICEKYHRKENLGSDRKKANLFNFFKKKKDD